MLDLAALQSLIRSLPIAIEEGTPVKLAGDASNRMYYRITGKSASLILMVLADPEGFKRSEEAVSGPPPEIAELPFINIQRHLKASGVPVPEIFHYDPIRGWLLLEDLGDITLARAVEGEAMTSEGGLGLYQKAIDVLIQMQRWATPQALTFAHSRAFDQSLFMWEFDHFIEYGIENRTGITLPEKRKRAIRAAFSDIALQLATLPPVFVHRDYHSRNIMVRSEQTLHLIDFQDALMGPRQYDLASLLKDSYMDLPDEVIGRLIAYYLERWEDETGEAISKEPFCEQFDLIGIQRNLKAAGRFVYIDQVKKNPAFLPFVPKTLLKVKRTLERNRRLKPLHDLLSEFVQELQ